VIQGAFVSGRPYVEAQIVIPYINDSGRRATASGDVRLLDAMPVTTVRLGGIGGPARVRLCRGTLHLLDDTRGWLPFPTEFLVHDARSTRLPLDLNILGADIWGQGDVHVNRPDGVVSLEFPAPEMAP
jgi:hypothetical protein